MDNNIQEQLDTYTSQFEEVTQQINNAMAYREQLRGAIAALQQLNNVGEEGKVNKEEIVNNTLPFTSIESVDSGEEEEE